MTRAFGDAVAASVGVICQPEIVECSRHPALACTRICVLLSVTHKGACRRIH